MNAIILSDWSITVARQNVFRALEDFVQEILANATYGRVNIIRYDANLMASQMSQTSFVWLNPRPSVILPDMIRSFFASVSEAHSRNRIAEVERLTDE